MTCRSKISKIVLIRNPGWPPQIYFELLLLSQKANWLETWYDVSGQLVVKKKRAKLLHSEIHNSCMVAILKIYFELLLNGKANCLETW